jgi:hypothetical protein
VLEKVSEHVKPSLRMFLYIKSSMNSAFADYFTALSVSSPAVINMGYAYPLGVRHESSKVARSSNKVAKLADYPVKCLYFYKTC